MRYPLVMDCAEVSSLVDAWERDGEFPGSLLGDFSEHLASCAACSARFGPLAPLIVRDSGDAGALSAAVSREAVAELASAVIRSRRPPRRARSASLAAMAAAAAAVFALGLWFGVGMERRAQSETIVVQFLLDAPAAREVALVGNFNRWSSGRNPMVRGGPDKPWEIRLKLKKGSMYVYNFLVDGNAWLEDPAAPEKIDDGFGGTSSLLRL
jgi:hypothetical protein